MRDRFCLSHQTLREGKILRFKAKVIDTVQSGIRGASLPSPLDLFGHLKLCCSRAGVTYNVHPFFVSLGVSLEANSHLHRGFWELSNRHPPAAYPESSLRWVSMRGWQPLLACPMSYMFKLYNLRTPKPASRIIQRPRSKASPVMFLCSCLDMLGLFQITLHLHNTGARCILVRATSC